MTHAFIFYYRLLTHFPKWFFKLCSTSTRRDFHQLRGEEADAVEYESTVTIICVERQESLIFKSGVLAPPSLSSNPDSATY